MVTSEKVAGVLIPATVRDEVADLVGRHADTPIGEVVHVFFFRDIGERVFVLRQDQ